MRKGSILIEFLIVLFAVTILAVVLLPVLSKMKERPKPAFSNGDKVIIKETNLTGSIMEGPVRIGEGKEATYKYEVRVNPVKGGNQFSTSHFHEKELAPIGGEPSGTYDKDHEGSY